MGRTKAMAIYNLATAEDDPLIPVKCPVGVLLVLDVCNFLLRLFNKTSDGLFRMPSVTNKHNR